MTRAAGSRTSRSAGAPAAGPASIVVFVAAAAIAPAAPGQFLERVDTIHVWDGEQPGDRFGFVNRVVGDVDEDGVVDLGVGVPLSQENGANAGKAYVYSGATGECIRTHLGQPQDYLGYEMGGVGDVNRDGVDDYVVGAPQTIDFISTSGNGRAILFSGATGEVLHTWTGETFGDGFGGQCGGAGNALQNGVGDIDADGTPDILIGAPVYGVAGPPVGRAYVYSGDGFEQVIHQCTGEAPIDLFGFAVGGLGDLDGDGHGEFIVGAPNAGPGDRGRAYVYSGKTGDQLFYSPLEPEITGGFFAFLFASGPGDVSGDGVPDIAVTDLQDAENGVGAGKAYVFSGFDGSPVHVIPGAGPGEGFGSGRGGCGDVNFDGHADLLFSAFTSDAGGDTAGRAFVFSGADASILRTITNTVPLDQFGYSTLGVGDVNGDRAPDFMISADLADGNGEDTGRVYVIAGVLPDGVPGDADGNGVVNVDDLVAVITGWGACPEPPEPCPADLDGSGQVDVDDLVLVILNWT